MFGVRFARHIAARYRRRGLDATEQRIVNFIADRGLKGATVLEIGGGVGELHVELLRRGAQSATCLELTAAYDGIAHQLATQAKVSDRIERRVLDIAVTPTEVAPADVVVLHRVVCCYPDFEALLGAAADHARCLLVFSHPPRNAASRVVMGAQNLAFRASHKTFRTFTHPPEQMHAVLEGRGLRPVYAHQGLVWRLCALERTPA